LELSHRSSRQFNIIKMAYRRYLAGAEMRLEETRITANHPEPLIVRYPVNQSIIRGCFSHVVS
jgi:hypothetical protein